jgi:tRNA(Ile)-lysidine synthase
MLSHLAGLAPEAKVVLVAVSGGPDSVALLRLLHQGPYRLEVAHFDHALRSESAEDAAFVRALCSELGVPCHVERVEVVRIADERGWNLEDAARRLRYSFLTRTAKRVGAEAVVTGHTLDDQAETVLMQLLRGTAFLTGMPPRQGWVVRPLLAVRRSELLDYLQQLSQPYRQDESNLDTKRTRAWLRLELLPRLVERYPNWLERLSHLATWQRDQRLLLDELAAPLLDEAGIALEPLRRALPALQRHALQLLLKRAGVPPDSAHLEALRQALEQSSPTRLSLPKGRLARVGYGRVEVLGSTGEKMALTPAVELPPEVDPEKAQAFGPLLYRSRLPGDRIRLAAGSRKLSDLLIDCKIPREERNRLRVLAAGAEVLWVEGIATDVRVTKVLEDEDTRFMRLALEQARLAADAGEVPIGAVVVGSGEVISVSHNTTERDRDPTGHAELHAIRAAAVRLGDWRLTGCTLYVTLEPCAMCFGAMLQAHLPRLVYGAPNHREGALGSVVDLRHAPWKRQVAVRGGVLAREAGELLSAFFAAQR